MPIFKDTQKMYDVLGELFETLMKDESMYQKYIDSKITIKFIIHNPEGFLWVGNDGKVVCGEADYKPTIQMILDGDTCHKFWLHRRITGIGAHDEISSLQLRCSSTCGLLSKQTKESQVRKR